MVSREVVVTVTSRELSEEISHSESKDYRAPELLFSQRLQKTVYVTGSLHLECRVFLEAWLCSNHPLPLEDQGNQDSGKGTGQ